MVAYEPARSAFNALIASNATFGALLFPDLGEKLGALAQRHSQRELHELTMAHVDEALLRPAHLVDGAASIVDVAAATQAQHASSVLVTDRRMGIFTNTGLRRAATRSAPSAPCASSATGC